MTQYGERLEEAGIPEKIAVIRQQLGALSAETRAAIENYGPGELERLEIALDSTLIAFAIAATVPELVATSALGHLLGALRLIGEALPEEGEEPNLVETLAPRLADGAEQLVTALLEWPRSGSPDWRDEVINAASTYRRSLAQQLVAVQADIEAGREMLASLQSETNALARLLQQTNVETTRSLQVAQTTTENQLASLDTQVARFGQQIDASLARADQTIATFQEQFSAAQEARAEEHRTSLASIDELSKGSVRTLKESGEEGLAELQQQIESARNMVSTFAAAGTAHSYGIEAKSQGTAADRWRYGAIGTGILAAMFAAALLIVEPSGNQDWSVVVGKLAVVLALGGLANYAALQSSRHRGREEYNRRLELSVVAFGPFIQELPEEKQLEMRENMAKSLFTTPGPTEVTPDDVLGSDQINLVSKLGDVFSRFIK